MLAIQVALCLLTGSLEMSVFQTLSAGNIWHFGAPGTGGPFATVVRGTDVAPVAPTATGTPARSSGRQTRAASRRGANGQADLPSLIHLRCIGAPLSSLEAIMRFLRRPDGEPYGRL